MRDVDDRRLVPWIDRDVGIGPDGDLRAPIVRPAAGLDVGDRLNRAQGREGEAVAAGGGVQRVVMSLAPLIHRLSLGVLVEVRRADVQRVGGVNNPVDP